MIVKKHKDFASGLMFTILGVAFAVGAMEYKFGSAAKMGPGYFPLLLGVLLAGIGIVITLSSLLGSPDPEARIGKLAYRPLICIIGANLLFGVLLAGLPSIGLPSFGFVVAIVALVFVSALASAEFNAKEVLVLSAVLAAGSYLVFVRLLNIPFEMWPAFIAG